MSKKIFLKSYAAAVKCGKIDGNEPVKEMEPICGSLIEEEVEFPPLNNQKGTTIIHISDTDEDESLPSLHYTRRRRQTSDLKFPRRRSPTKHQSSLEKVREKVYVIFSESKSSPVKKETQCKKPKFMQERPHRSPRFSSSDGSSILISSDSDTEFTMNKVVKKLQFKQAVKEEPGKNKLLSLEEESISSKSSDSDAEIVTKKRKYTNKFRSMTVHKVQYLPFDIDGECAFSLPYDKTPGNRMKSSVDGRMWSRYNKSFACDFKKVDGLRLKSKCKGSLQCPNKECLFNEYYGKPNSKHVTLFQDKNKCSECHTDLELIQCQAVETINLKQLKFFTVDTTLVFQ